MLKIVSGGQTGADRAALDWAIDNGVAHGGWCPAGRLAEDGTIPAHYRLDELAEAGYRQRTRRNVQDADATMVVNIGELDGGTRQTVQFAERAQKPLLVLALDTLSLPVAAAMLNDWLAIHTPAVLNVAGPRESKRPGIGQSTYKLLAAALELRQLKGRQTERPPPAGRPSQKLAQMLDGLTPEQVEQAIAITAKLLAIKAKK